MMEEQTSASTSSYTSGSMYPCLLKTEPKDDSSQRIEDHSDGCDMKELAIGYNVPPTGMYKIEDTLKTEPNFQFEGCEFMETIDQPEIKIENDSDVVSDCNKDSNMAKDHPPATTNIVQEDDGLNQRTELTEVPGEMDCKDGIRDVCNLIGFGGVKPTDVEQPSAADVSCSNDIQTKGKEHSL